MPHNYTPYTESIQFITSDGLKYNLHNPPKRGVLSIDGFGLPPWEMSTSKGPFQHGESPESVRLQTRTVGVTLRHQGLNRTEYWGTRGTLLDYMRMNRASVNAPVPGVLRWISYRNGVKTIRDLDVFLTDGLLYKAPTGWDHFAVQEDLTFTAFNPVVYDPTAQVNTITSFVYGLILPITFPIVLGLALATANITYLGTWSEYPIITITGPAVGFFIQNVSTGILIGLNYTISTGETVTIDLRYDRKTITNNLGDDLIGYVSSNSEVGNFSLEPNPLITNGINEILLGVDGPTSDTSVVITHYRRYIGT